MDSRFLKFSVLFYAYNKYSERHCVNYLRFTCISETWDRNPDIEAALEFYENDLPSPHVVDVELLRWKREWCSTEDADLPTSAVQTLAAYTLFQNGRHFSILLFDCKVALLASFKGKYSFEFYVWKRDQKGQFTIRQKNTKMVAILE